MQYGWYLGGVELDTGRLVGSRASHMSDLLHNGQYGPDSSRPAQAIVGSGCDNDAEDLANHLKSHGYDVLNDDESPRTVDDDDWRESDLLALMGGEDYQILHHGNHASEHGWTTPPCSGKSKLPSINLNDLQTTAIANRIGANHPVFTSNGCRSGLSDGRPLTRTVVRDPIADTFLNGLVRRGVSAVMASTGIAQFCHWPSGHQCGGEDFLERFWSRALRSPSAGILSTGAALRWNKHYWDGHWSVNAEEEKTGAEFTLYGVPWVTVFEGNNPTATQAGAAEGRALSAPQAVAAQTYVVTRAFDASTYTVMQMDGFDLVEVEGMPLGRDTGVPAVPLAIAELTLPLDGELLGVELITGSAAYLGELDVPQIVPGEPISGGNPGGPAAAPDIGVYPPQPAVSRTVWFEGHKIARAYASPLRYDTSTGEATLYQDLALRVTYRLTSPVGLLGLIADPPDPAPESSFWAAATLFNASDEAVTLTGTLRLEDAQGQTVAVQAVDPFDVPAGSEGHLLELEGTAPVDEGAYSLFLALWREGELQTIGHASLHVSGGRIAELDVPQSVLPGQAVPVTATFLNRRSTSFEGEASLVIYDAAGVPVTAFDPLPLAVEPEGEALAEWVWEGNQGATVGTYVAAVEVSDASGDATYGVVQESFELRHGVFLPLVLRSYS